MYGYNKIVRGRTVRGRTVQEQTIMVGGDRYAAEKPMTAVYHKAKGAQSVPISRRDHGEKHSKYHRFVFPACSGTSFEEIHGKADEGGNR